MKVTGKLLLVAGILMSTSTAIAEGMNVELTPFAGYRFGGTFDVVDSDASYELTDSPSYGLILDIRQKKNQSTQLEILYSRQETDALFSAALPDDPDIDVELQFLQIGGTYQGSGDKFRPYLAATIGGTHIATNGEGKSSDTFWSGSIGGGLQIAPNSRVGIRLEARFYGTLISSNSALFCGSGPEAAGCALSIDGKILSQFETMVGVVFRF